MADAVNALLFSIKLEREKGTAGRAGCREDAVVHWLGDCDVKLKFGVYKATKLRHAPRLATRSESELSDGGGLLVVCLLFACCLFVACLVLARLLFVRCLFAGCLLVACFVCGRGSCVAVVVLAVIAIL